MTGGKSRVDPSVLGAAADLEAAEASAEEARARRRSRCGVKVSEARDALREAQSGFFSYERTTRASPDPS